MRYIIETINLRKGRKGFIVLEKLGPSLYRPVWPGKVFRSAIDATAAAAELENS